MNNLSKLKSKQRGATFLGMLFIAAVVGILFIVGAKVVPTVIEYQAILKAVNNAKMASTVTEVRSTFDKTQATGYFDSISGKDLVIEKIADKKNTISNDVLCKDIPECFLQILDYIKKLKFEEKPNYQFIYDSINEYINKINEINENKNPKQFFFIRMNV